MKQLNKAVIIILALTLLAGGGIWYARRQLWKGQPANAIPITQKEQSPLDLRPAAIAKLQQLVLQGSDGLYKLRIDSLLTDLASGGIVLKGVGILPDSAAIGSLNAGQKLPDDIFEIELRSLRITGISLADILHRRDLHLGAVVCESPQISVHHRLQAYNADERAKAKRQTLYQRMQGQIDRLAIDSITCLHSDLTDYSNGQKATYKDVSLALRDVLLDSMAERDKTRFLFAKKALLQTGAMQLPVGRSKYDLSIGGVVISGEAKTISIKNLSLKPHGGRAVFMSHQKTQTEVYDVNVPLMILRGAGWWAAVHGESLLAESAEISGASIGVFLDQRLASGAGIKRNNFPQQMLADAGIKVSLRQVSLTAATLVYDEITRSSGVQSQLTFNGINAVAEGLTNIPNEVSAKPTAHLSGSCRFMNTAAMSGDFTLQLPRKQKGAFKADLKIGRMSHDAVNPFSEGMGLIRFTSGELQGATAHIEGNNDNVHGTIAAGYSDLHVEPLKSQEDDKGRLKGKHVTKTIANLVFVKNNNPAKGGELRQPSFSLDRTTEGNFFNFIWMGLKRGLLRTIGVPAKLGGM